MWTEDRMTKDLQENLSPEERTMARVQEMANRVVKDIIFTVDLPERHLSKQVPMLDVAVWVETDQGGNPTVRHTYYEKPSTSPLVFHGRGACSVRQKIVVMAEEGKRRLLNMV